MARPSTLWQSLIGPWRGPEYTATNHPQLCSGSSSSRRLQLELSSLSSQEAGALKRLDDLAPKLTAARQAELLRLECEHTANYIRLLRARLELARARESAAADSLGPVDTRSSDDLQRHAPGGEPAQTSTAACAASPTPSASCSSSGLPSSCWQGADQGVEQEGIEAQSRRVSELSSSTSALLAQMVAARRRAAALRQPSVREETLRDLLARARLAFDGGERLRLYAPMAEIQRRFEEVVCAPGSREARLFSSWVRHIAPHGHSGEPTTLDAATASEVTMGLCAMDCEPHLRGDACCRFRLLESACYFSPSERRFGSVDQATGAYSGVTTQSYGLSCVVTGHRFLCSPLDSQLGSLPSPSRSSLLPSVASSASRRSLEFSPSAESLFAASASSPAGGLLPSTVVDFISYFARVVAKTYHLEESVVAPATSRAGATADVASTRLPLLLPLEQCAARLVFSSAFPVLFPPIRTECACKDAAFLRQQRWMRMLPDAAIAGECRQDGPNDLAANSAGIGTTSVRLDQDFGDNADIRHTARSGDAAGAFRASATADATASGPDTPATSAATAAHSPGSNETNPLAHFTTDGDATFGLAVGALSELSYATVPIDSLLCVMRAVRHLHESAAKATGIPVTAIGADLLQPLLVLAAVRADLPCAFSMVTFTSRYSSSQVAKSEPGYYLACLEVALEYILSATPAELGADVPFANVAEAAHTEMLRAEAVQIEHTRQQVDDFEAGVGEGTVPAAGDGGSECVFVLAVDGGSEMAQQEQAPGEPAKVGFVPGSTSVASETGATPGAFPPAAASEAVRARRDLLDFLQRERDLSDLVDSLAL